MKGTGKGRPKSLAFEHQVRTILASGSSARAAQDHVLSSARVYLTPAAFAEYEQHVPNKRWSYPSTPDRDPTSTPKQILPLPLNKAFALNRPNTLNIGSSTSVKHWGTKLGSTLW
jgi:hypothetical protein